jgi:hypothetical protein
MQKRGAGDTGPTIDRIRRTTAETITGQLLLEADELPEAIDI